MHLNPAGLLTFFFLKTDPVGFYLRPFLSSHSHLPQNVFFSESISWSSPSHCLWAPQLQRTLGADIHPFCFKSWSGEAFNVFQTSSTVKSALTFDLHLHFTIPTKGVFHYEHTQCDRWQLIRSNWDISCKGVFIDQNY